MNRLTISIRYEHTVFLEDQLHVILVGNDATPVVSNYRRGVRPKIANIGILTTTMNQRSLLQKSRKGSRVPPDSFRGGDPVP